MLRKIRCNAWTILSILLVLCGILMFTYPRVINKISNQYTKQEIETFQKAVQSIKQQEADTAVAMDEKAIITGAEVTPMEELLKKVQEYNLTIYEDGQSNLVDPFSYEVSSIQLSEYGIADGMFGYIEIPKIKVRLGLYLGATTQNMSKGAVHLTQTSLPIGGINTNAVIAAHRGTKSHGDMFRNINKIEIGDEVRITNMWEILTYQVESIAIIEPDEIDKILIQEGKDMITLISCNPYGKNIQRYVVCCERKYNEKGN